MTKQMESVLHAAKELVDAASQITVLTGAGISTDSGIPDFRGPEGLWTKNPEAEKASHIDYYMSDPEIRKQAWQRLIKNAEAVKEGAPQPKPNPGHYAIARLHERMKLHTLVTQNVDGLHLDSGIPPEKIVEIHGTREKDKVYELWGSPGDGRGSG